MRWIFAALVYAWAAVASAQVGGLAFPGPGPKVASGGGSFSLTFSGSGGSGTTGTNSITYGPVTYGSGCNELILETIWYNTTSTDTISGITSAAGTASAIPSTATTVGSNGGQNMGAYKILSPSGTSASFTVTYSANVTYNSAVGVFCLVSGNTTLAGAASTGASNPNSATVTVPAGGAAAVAAAGQAGQVITPTNWTIDGTYTGGGVDYSWGHTTGTGSVTVSATTATDNMTIIAAAAGP